MKWRRRWHCQFSNQWVVMMRRIRPKMTNSSIGTQRTTTTQPFYFLKVAMKLPLHRFTNGKTSLMVSILHSTKELHTHRKKEKKQFLSPCAWFDFSHCISLSPCLIWVTRSSLKLPPLMSRSHQNYSPVSEEDLLSEIESTSRTLYSNSVTLNQAAKSHVSLVEDIDRDLQVAIFCV